LMIIVRLNGGLGNQMFQYALGRRLAFERKVPLWLDLDLLRRPRRPNERAYSLDAFHISPTKRLVRPYVLGQLKLSQFAGHVRLIKEMAYHALQDIPCGRSLVLDGFWQREEYFAPIAETIRHEFQLKTPLIAERQKIADRVGDNAVSIHVRRSDYTEVPSYSCFFGTCTSDWYETAVAIMRERVKNPHFFVFSDDPAWARANLPISGQSVEFVDPRPDQRDFEDLHLMSRCAHHIIANSSFSWWAAWLNPSPAKIVVAPKVWYKGAPETPAHALADWIRL
jgi:hypothetical protein